MSDDEYRHFGGNLAPRRGEVNGTDQPPLDSRALVTLLKIIAAVGAVWIWRELVWVMLLVLIAVIIAVGPAPAVSRLEQRGRRGRWRRWGLVLAIVGSLFVDDVVDEHQAIAADAPQRRAS